MIKYIKWLKKEKNLIIVSQKIKQGEIIVIPTDTIYGILANCFSIPALDKIYKIKKRDKNKPLLVLVSDFKMMEKVVPSKEIQSKKNILNKIMKKPVTVILPAKKNLPKAIVKDGKIAVRIPQNDILKKLIKYSDAPLVAPSANLEGEKPKRFCWQIIKEFKNKVSYIFWRFFIWDIRPSTIIDLTGDEIKYVRIGRVKRV